MPTDPKIIDICMKGVKKLFDANPFGIGDKLLKPAEKTIPKKKRTRSDRSDGDRRRSHDDRRSSHDTRSSRDAKSLDDRRSSGDHRTRRSGDEPRRSSGRHRPVEDERERMVRGDGYEEGRRSKRPRRDSGESKRTRRDSGVSVREKDEARMMERIDDYYGDEKMVKRPAPPPSRRSERSRREPRRR